MQRISLKNAVLYKDMMVRAKRSNMTVLIFVINLILCIVASIVLIAINAQLSSFSAVSTIILPWFFIGVMIYESLVVCLVIPPATSSAISGERERQTLDVLLTTNMSTLDIVLGKYLSCLVYVGLLLLSTLPMLAIVFIYGSINFIQILAVYGSLMVVAMFLASFGIFCSTVVKKSSSATILSFLIFFFLIFGTIILVLLIFLFVELRNSALYTQIHVNLTAVEHKADISMFLLYLNPAATVFDTIGRIIGYNFDPDTVGGMNYIIGEVTSYSQSNIFVRFWSIISIVIQLVVSWLMLLASARVLDPSTRRKVKRERNRKTA